MSELSFAGRTVLITGAGRGLGRAHAFAFAARGAAVVVNDLDESADEVAADIRGLDGVAEALVGDVAVPAVAEAAVAQAINRFGQLDVVVANAGIDAITPLREVTPQLLTEYFRVHVLGTWGVCSAVWPHFVDRHYGRIVTTTSAAGYFGLRRALPYATAKGALHAMTQTLAAEGARNGITANAIAPFAASRLARNRTRSAPQLYDAIERFAPPSAVSPVVLWLAHETTTVSGAAFEVGAGGVSRIEVAVGETASVEADPASWSHGELTVAPVEAADRPLTRWLGRQAAEM